MTLTELKRKRVILTETGREVGRIDDIQLDKDGAGVQYFILFGPKKLFGLLGREPSVYVDRAAVQSFGEDVVFVQAIRQEKAPTGPRR